MPEVQPAGHQTRQLYIGQRSDFARRFYRHIYCGFKGFFPLFRPLERGPGEDAMRLQIWFRPFFLYVLHAAQLRALGKWRTGSAAVSRRISLASH